MKKSFNNKSQIANSTTSQVLNLDSETTAKLQTVSNYLDRTPSEVIKEFVYSIDRLFSRNKINGNNIIKDRLAFSFDLIIQHLHLLPQIAESISLLTGRDTDIVIGNLDIDLEMNFMAFSLGLGLYDLEKVFVTIQEGHVQLFSNRYLNDKYTIEEVEKIKEYAHKKVKESVPYAAVTIGIVESNSKEKKSPDLSNKSDELYADKAINIKEVELTIRSHNIRYVPTFHKFNALMDDIIYYFEKHIKN